MIPTRLFYGAAFVLAVIAAILLGLSDTSVSLRQALAFLAAAVACLALAPVVA